MNSGKVSFILILIGVILLSACGQKTLTFSGESVNWSVEYEFTQDGDFIESTGTIKYIGPQPAPAEIEYSLKNQSGNGPLAGNGVYYLGKSGCSNCSLPSEDSEFEVIIKWNDHTEKITLTME